VSGRDFSKLPGGGGTVRGDSVGVTSRILVGDVRDVLRRLPDGAVHCVVTSPPYWALRDYGVDGQLGGEATPEEYVETMLGVFREVRRVLRDDGTLWLNLGDSYINGKGASGGTDPMQSARRFGARPNDKPAPPGFKRKDLVLIPFMVAAALRADGWYLRQDIIWHKRNPMPESAKDRPTTSHEHVFLLSKSIRYYYDAAAIAEPIEHPDDSTQDDVNRAFSRRRQTATEVRQEPITKSQQRDENGLRPSGRMGRAPGWRHQGSADQPTMRNKRSVWSISTEPFGGAHFATFPTKLVEPCILAGCPDGGTVLDPFAGAGTTGLVASRLGRRFIGVELSAPYAELARARIAADAPLLNRVDVA
jgi:DNA modification methylase